MLNTSYFIQSTQIIYLQFKIVRFYCYLLQRKYLRSLLLKNISFTLITKANVIKIVKYYLIYLFIEINFIF